MIDTTGQCSACGQTVGIDTIHTCSPQVTAPTPERRVGEELLSAEWVRVISEDGAVLGYWLAEGGTKLRSEVVESEAAKFLALDLLDERAAVARLTAEVERLRGIAEQAIGMLNEWDESMASYQQGTSDGTTAKELAARLAALSLPTPAPEAGR